MGTYPQYSTIPIDLQAVAADGVTPIPLQTVDAMWICVQPYGQPVTVVEASFLTDGSDGWVTIDNDGYFDFRGKFKCQLFYEMGGVRFGHTEPIEHSIIPSMWGGQ